MVWLHGGGLTVGESDDYDPTRLVKQGVIVVTVNYRLGYLGFLAHPALSAESGGQGSGNYGLMDQQAALRWVQRNIKKFGGDDDNVTIFGQSAGGLSVHSHLVSPTAKGLFDRAIAQSGAYTTGLPSLAAAEIERDHRRAGLRLPGPVGGMPARDAAPHDPGRPAGDRGCDRAQHRRQRPHRVDRVRARERQLQPRAGDRGLHARRVHDLRGAVRRVDRRRGDASLLSARRQCARHDAWARADPGADPGRVSR